MFPCTIKNSFSSSSFFFSICFWMPFLLFLKFLWRLWRLGVHNCCSSCVVKIMGNFLLRVVSGILPAMFFLRSVHTFSWFLKSNWSSDFGHAEAGNGAKKRLVCGVNFYRTNFKVEWENGVWTKIRSRASGFLFTCGNFSLVFIVFSIFGSDFFLNGFSNSLIVRSRSSFLFSQLKFFELYVRTCPAMFFLINFIGVNFEAGNETREKIWTDFVAQQNEEWSGFSNFFGWGLDMIFFKFYPGVGSGLKVSWKLYEIYAISVVIHVFCWYLG